MQDLNMLQYMQNMTPEQIQALTRDYQGEQGALDTQMAQGQALRNREAPQGMSVGDQFFASDPLEMLSNVGNNAIGAYQQGKAREGMAGLGADKSKATSDLMKALIAQKQMAAQQTMPVRDQYGINNQLASGVNPDVDQLQYR